MNDLPSTVIGILNEPLRAKDVPALAVIFNVTPSDCFVIVNPFTVGKVPIVGLIVFKPLYAITFVVVETSELILPELSAGNE